MGGDLTMRTVEPRCIAIAVPIFLISFDIEARQLAYSDVFTATVSDSSPCRTSLPITVRAPDSSAFANNPAAIQKLIGGIRMALDFECEGKTAPQKFEITGESGGQIVYHGRAERSEDWILDSIETNKTAMPPRQPDAPEQPTIAATAVPDQRCDKLAAHPDDPDKPHGVRGVGDDAIDVSAAIDACTDAAEAHPEERRYAFELGRVLMLSGEKELAAGLLQQAAAAGSAAAIAYLGDLEEDSESARELYQTAADGGFAPAAKVIAAYANQEPTALPSARDNDDVNPEPTKNSTSDIPAAPSTDKSKNSKSKNFNSFNNPEIIRSLYNGNFKSLDNYQSGLIAEERGVPGGLIKYLSSFADQINNPYQGIGCPGALRAGVSARLMQRLTNSISRLTPDDYLGAFNIILGPLVQAHKMGGDPFTSGWQAGQEIMGNIAQGSTELGTLEEAGQKDALILAQNYGCNSDMTRKITSNLNKYALR